VARFTSLTSSNTYMINTTAVNRYQAEESCAAQGGHVVSFTSITEQFEVEHYFIDQGVLLPEYHSSYWLGLYIPQVSTNFWPNFKWLDGMADPSNPSLQTDKYAHWGRLVLGDGSIRNEPNNLDAPEFCVTANWTQTFDSVWGWSDQNCDDYHIFMCKVAAPPPPLPPPPPPSPFPPGPPLDPAYVSQAQRASYFYFGQKARWADAQEQCKGLGGGLVVYTTLAKQQEIEGVFLSRGLLKNVEVRGKPAPASQPAP
jgi:hypothetical protein